MFCLKNRAAFEESEVLKSRKEVYQEKLEEYNGRLKEVPLLGVGVVGEDGKSGVFFGWLRVMHVYIQKHAKNAKHVLCNI